MPILNRIQQRSIGGRLLVAVIYVVLALGAVTMVYPFLLMLSGSVKSEVDMRQLDVVPRFLYDDAALFRRFEEQRYVRLDVFNAATLYHDENGQKLFSFEQLEPPAPMPARLVGLWEEFLEEQGGGTTHLFALGHFAGSRSVAELQIVFQREVFEKFPNVPRADVIGPTTVENWGIRLYQPMQGPFAEVYHDMRSRLPRRYFYPVSLRGYFLTHVLSRNYPPGKEGLRRLNDDWRGDFKSFSDVPLPRIAPASSPAREAWWTFVRDMLSARFIQVEAPLGPAYRAFLQSKYGDIEKLNESHHTRWSSWDEIVPPSPGQSAVTDGDTEAFLKTLPGPDGLRLVSLDFAWIDFLKAKFSDSIDRLNEAFGAAYRSFEEVPMPTFQYDYALTQRHRGEIVREFLTRNYRVAWDRVVAHGNGLQNTLIFCGLNILVALIVNPLAAYALSRFRPRWGQQAIFIMMATMAFPAEVTQIPSFLLLRDLGMLNTFAALVIPAAANGYSIFLLKGFFDSLPQDLYEAANIDGCGEIRAFFQITMPLSAPILAVIALSAFTAAYGAFMFALLVCQKESMWTLMVYIYQLQQSYAQPVIFAALVIAAVPTLLVFVFCQNIIMRGIVVPVEK